MFESHDLIECPLCRSRMNVPHQGGTRVFTCREGHRFEWESPARPLRWASRAQVVTILVVAMLVALILAARHWPARVPFIRLG